VYLFVAVVATALLLFELLLVARAVLHWSVAVGVRRSGWAGSRGHHVPRAFVAVLLLGQPFCRSTKRS
jgi:hypothetical protein